MALLRKLRMRRAANLLTAETFSIEQIATLAVTPAAAVSREFSGKSMRPFRTTIWRRQVSSPLQWEVEGGPPEVDAQRPSYR
jgi:transcriptional regulator GlxA family with amidase domain